MSGGAGPSQYFSSVFGLYQQGTNQFQVGFEFNLGSATVSDTPESGESSLAQIGDITGDAFRTDSASLGSNFAFVGTTTDGSGFVGKNVDSGSYYLFTNKSYSDLQFFSVTSQPYTIVCFSSGTLISTARGEVAVEELTVGDRAVTASGEERPIRWIGHRTLKCRGRADLLPVRIARDAFGEGRPARDLLVSPGHAVCVDLLGEVLVPACRLINGTTIARVAVDTVTYWHVELDSHDILFAEGLPAESYLDMGNRRFFAEADGVDLALGPDVLGPDALAGRTTADFCRPFHEDGPLVTLLRARLEDRARALGWTRVETPVADLHLVADGRVIHPDSEGLSVRFVLPAEAGDVRLVSGVSVPAHVVAGSTDERRLGVSLAAITLDDGLTGARTVALDDPRLAQGFHPVDGDAAASWRWTDGDAVLPAVLWAGCRGTLFLRLALATPPLPRWIGPRDAADPGDLR